MLNAGVELTIAVLITTRSKPMFEVVLLVADFQITESVQVWVRARKHFNFANSI